MLGPGPVGALPEVNEMEDLLGLFALAEIRVGIAEGVPLGILGQEGEYTLLPPAPHRHVVALDDGMLPVIGAGVEIEIEGAARKEVGALDGLLPGGQELGGNRVIDPRRGLREVAPLRDGVEPGEERQALI